ncbi:Metalloreductase, putative [Penicillium digitatum Pd1]|nr:Metalloreductase, putative [Penicillium digitatum Pd1]EKV21577.1 Metalloreductase, putative [Penicillium digitatum Pd1]
MAFPLSAAHLSFLAGLLGISWRSCRKIHRATGWMAVVLLSFHITAELQGQKFSFSLSETRNLLTVIV